MARMQFGTQHRRSVKQDRVAGQQKGLRGQNPRHPVVDEIVLMFQAGADAFDPPIISSVHAPATLARFGRFRVGFFVGHRYYFTRKHTFIRPYVGIEGDFLWMSWRYRDAIIFDDETIRYDSTEGADGYVGLGVIFGSNKSMNVFGEIGAGGGFFLGTTDEGLENDVFDPYGYIGARIGLRFRF